MYCTFNMAKRAFAAGKHVMCEKPLAMVASESAELVDIARAAGRAWLEACVTINAFIRLILEARARIARGRHRRCIYHQRKLCAGLACYTIRITTGVFWLNKGGELRAVSDIGTHWMDLVCSITGLDVEAVFADSENRTSRSEEASGRNCYVFWWGEQTEMSSRFLLPPMTRGPYCF